MTRQTRSAIHNATETGRVAERARRTQELVRETTAVGTIAAHGTHRRVRCVILTVETSRTSLASVVAPLILIGTR